MRTTIPSNRHIISCLIDYKDRFSEVWFYLDQNMFDRLKEEFQFNRLEGDYYIFYNEHEVEDRMISWIKVKPCGISSNWYVITQINFEDKQSVYIPSSDLYEIIILDTTL